MSMTIKSKCFSHPFLFASFIFFLPFACQHPANQNYAGKTLPGIRLGCCARLRRPSCYSMEEIPSASRFWGRVWIWDISGRNNPRQQVPGALGCFAVGEIRLPGRTKKDSHCSYLKRRLVCLFCVISYWSIFYPILGLFLRFYKCPYGFIGYFLVPYSTGLIYFVLSGIMNFGKSCIRPGMQRHSEHPCPPDSSPPC